VLGFLSVSTTSWRRDDRWGDRFQSRAGFSECLDRSSTVLGSTLARFNPVLGFLSVSTSVDKAVDRVRGLFQSRAGFSECLDSPAGATASGW